jgi:cell division transport system permease protein
MALFGKRSSSSKGKPSYFMSILGVTIVLFIWGLLGLIFIYLNSFRRNMSERLEVNFYVQNTATQPEIDSFISMLRAQPYAKLVTFTDKEQAKNILVGSKDESIDFGVIEDMGNPLQHTVSLTVNDQFMIPDSLTRITQTLTAQYPRVVESTQYSKDVVEAINKSVKNIKVGLLVAALVLTLLVVLLNTIKLAMYSNRFLIKTMQMVGATRWFIAKPIDLRAILNGFISAVIAIIVLYGIVVLVESKIPDIEPFRDNAMITWLFIGIIIVGVVITLASTHRSVIKYLKMKLDDLY